MPGRGRQLIEVDRCDAEARAEAIRALFAQDAAVTLPCDVDDDLLAQSLLVFESLEREGVDYAVIGGVALNIHGLIRATEDLDLFIRATPENVEALRRALRAVWDDPEIDKITAEDLCGDYPAVRYGPPKGALYLDILTRIGERARFEDLDVEERQIGTVRVRVASPHTLHWLKKDTVRPIDKADAVALRQAFDLSEDD